MVELTHGALQTMAEAIHAMTKTMKEVFQIQTETIQELKKAVDKLSKTVSLVSEVLSVAHGKCPRLTHCRKPVRRIPMRMPGRRAIFNKIHDILVSDVVRTSK